MIQMTVLVCSMAVAHDRCTPETAVWSQTGITCGSPSTCMRQASDLVSQHPPRVGEYFIIVPEVRR